MPDRLHIVGLPHRVSEKLGRGCGGVRHHGLFLDSLWLLASVKASSSHLEFILDEPSPSPVLKTRVARDVESELSSPGALFDGDAIARGCTAEK